MATLRITFTAASPAPANGYKISYRKAGSADAWSTVNTATSPVDITVQDGFNYTGNIVSDCGGGVFSNPVQFDATLALDPCYLYEFTNNGTTNATVYYEVCNNPGVVIQETVIPQSSGGTQLNVTCAITSSIVINSFQVPPGTVSGTSPDNVVWVRAVTGC